MLAQIQTTVGLIYPPACLSCGGAVDRHAGLCGPCWRDTAFIGGVVCDSCGIPLPGGSKGEVSHCDGCLAHPPPWVQGRSAFLYADAGRKMVLALKHGDRQEIAKPAALWMARAFRGKLPAETLVAPVPLHWQRLVKRRYNQSALLGRALARETGLAWCPDLLKRVRKTASLDGKSRIERFEILQDAIYAHPKRQHLMLGRPVLIVDDVMTSGATLFAAARACIDAGAGPIRVVTLARVAKDT
ncbi:ComF family protein [uncultured Sulfitobacter sp.]|jgi:ComF family protein|uniref:ComF family protein n=1 Tax=Sulfitobacter sp. SH22 TaxID=3421172 RepID=UPI0025E0A6AD|nr:ComF family protein [uncultured Sulfitobacter sp.]